MPNSSSQIAPTPLCELAYKYGADKCPQIKHSYTPFYWELLKDKRESIKKVLEIGIGHNLVMKHVEKARGFYKNGASLYMWRDFFSNAQIYGADIEAKSLFCEERIETFLCDQSNRDDLLSLMEKIGSDIDIVIDDGSHKLKDQIFTCLALMPILKKDVFYIIEDARYAKEVSSNLDKYDCLIPNLNSKFSDDKLVVVRNKQ